MAMSSITPSHVQTMVKSLSATMAPGSVRGVYSVLAAIFRTAIRDRVVANSPAAADIRLPEVAERQVEPLSLEQVEILADAVGPLYRPLGRPWRRRRPSGGRSARNADRRDRLPTPAALRHSAGGHRQARDHDRSTEDEDLRADRSAGGRCPHRARLGTRRPPGRAVLTASSSPTTVRPSLRTASARRGRGLSARWACRRAPVPRSAPHLRQRPDHHGLLGQGGPGAPGPQERGHDARHLLPPVAARRRPGPGRSSELLRRRCVTCVSR